jgi:hypothetical protein
VAHIANDVYPIMIAIKQLLNPNVAHIGRKTTVKAVICGPWTQQLFYPGCTGHKTTVESKAHISHTIDHKVNIYIKPMVVFSHIPVYDVIRCILSCLYFTCMLLQVSLS